MPGEWRLPLLTGDSFEFVDPTPDGVEHIADNLRESDAREIEATIGAPAYLAALQVSLAAARSAVMAVNAYGVPVALFGVSTVSVLYNTGCPWLVATGDVNRHRAALIECGRAYTAFMLSEYGRLENHVDVRNLKSVAWLQHLGYRMDEPTPYGALKLPFHRFWIER